MRFQDVHGGVADVELVVLFPVSKPHYDQIDTPSVNLFDDGRSRVASLQDFGSISCRNFRATSSAACSICSPLSTSAGVYV